MSILESVDFTSYTDDELRQQYSLTFKIRAYYESCLSNPKTVPIYTLLLKQAEADLEDVKRELLGRDCPIPDVKADVEEVATDITTVSSDAEKNEEAPEEGEESTATAAHYGQVSYQTPVVVRKLSDDTADS